MHLRVPCLLLALLGMLMGQQPVTARAWHGEPDGWNGFSVVDVDDAAFALRDVGCAASLRQGRRDQPLEPLDDPTVEAMRAVVAAGWTWLEPDMLELYVPGLRIRGYQDDGPTRLADLLFYWLGVSTATASRIVEDAA